MDIQQLRSWILELYDPLENDRQYIVYDAARGNLLIDVPPFSDRALRLIRGGGPASLLVVTNAARAAEAVRYRDAIGVQIAAHAEDADAISGGPDVVLKDEDAPRPDVRSLRVRADGGARSRPPGDREGADPALPAVAEATPGVSTPAPAKRKSRSKRKESGATVLLLRKAGGVLVCGDLDLASDAARALLSLEFSAVLSAGRPPMWNAGKDVLMQLQRELPRPPKRFSIFLDAPWDRAYKGRLEDQMTWNETIVPKEKTVEREAAMGPETLVVSDVTRRKMERAKRPVRD